VTSKASKSRLLTMMQKLLEAVICRSGRLAWHRFW
jgi:hypothetical protein